MNRQNLLRLLLVIGILSLSGCFAKKKPGSQIKTSGKISEEQATYIFTEATKLKLFGKHKEALRLLNKYVEKYPQSHAAYYQMAQMHLNNRDIDRAEENIKKAIKIDSTNDWYQDFLVNIYRMDGDIKNLIQVYEKKLDKGRNDDISYQLAMLHQRQGNYKRAIELLDNLEENFGVKEEINIPKYENYLMLNKNDSAYQEINKLIRLFPERAEYYGLLAEFYLEEGDLESAKKNYDKLFDIDSGSVQGKISYVDYLVKSDQFEEAFSWSKDIIEDQRIGKREKVELLIGLLSKQDVLADYQIEMHDLIRFFDKNHPSETSALTLYADFYLKSGQQEKALDKLKKLVKIDKGNYMYWEQLILIENQKGNTDSVIKYSESALEHFSKIPNLYLINGISYFFKENYKEAVVKLEEGYIINDNEELEQQFIIYLAESYNKLEQYEEADKYFKKAISKYPENYAIKNNYAYYLSLREERLDYAEKISKETLDVEPGNATYLDTYAWILYKQEKYRKAYKYIEKAIQMGAGDNAEVLDHCGDILVELGKIEDAVHMYKQALQYDENNMTIKNKLEQYETDK